VATGPGHFVRAGNRRRLAIRYEITRRAVNAVTRSNWYGNSGIELVDEVFTLVNEVVALRDVVTPVDEVVEVVLA